MMKTKFNTFKENFSTRNSSDPSSDTSDLIIIGVIAGAVVAAGIVLLIIYQICYSNSSTIYNRRYPQFNREYFYPQGPPFIAVSKPMTALTITAATIACNSLNQMTLPFARPIDIPAELRLGDLSNPPTIVPLNRIESGVNNGDCVLGVVVVALECIMHGNIRTSKFVQLAAELRQHYIRWCTQHWNSTPAYCNMTVNEIVHLNHHLGVTFAQQARRDWGTTPEEHLNIFEQLGPSLLLGEGDLTLISCMISITGARLQFRIWRYQNGVHTHITSCPDDESLVAGGVREAVVIDVEHAGSLDSHAAHYKLLVSASLYGLCRIVRTPSTSSTSSTLADPDDPTDPTDPTILASDHLPTLTNHKDKERNERAIAAELRMCGKRVRP
jgi:hypothetical protein